jgi:polysaccharide pyruvyl transferase WcaK-like protein
MGGMRIALWGNFGALNLGNECTLAAAVSNIRARLPDAELIAICRDPEDTAKRHRIAGIPMSGRGQPAEARRYPKLVRILRLVGREAAAWVRAFRHASTIDALLITGSGILSDEGEGTLGLPYELFKWSLVTKLRGKQLFYVSVGADSIARPMSRAFLKGALKLADYRCYRDVHSAKLLQSLGFRTDQDVVRPDLAFSLPRSVAVTHGAVMSERGGLRPRRVAVGVFNYRGRGQANSADAAAYHAYLDRICSLIQWLLAREYQVRVVIGDFNYDEDVRLDARAELARRGLELTSPLFADEPATSFEQLLDQLSAVDFVIASRYHNVLLGLLLGKPVVSLSYEGKHEALMRAMGLADYCQTIDDLDVKRLVEQFQRLEKNADSLRAVIVERVAANRASLEEQYDLIVRSVCGRPSRRA